MQHSAHRLHAERHGAVVQHSAPTLHEADELIAIVLHSLVHHRTDHSIQARTVPASGQHTNAHRKTSQVKNIRSIKSYVNRSSGLVPHVTLPLGRELAAMPLLRQNQRDQKAVAATGRSGDCEMEGMDWMVRALGLEPRTNALKGRPRRFIGLHRLALRSTQNPHKHLRFIPSTCVDSMQRCAGIAVQKYPQSTPWVVAVLCGGSKWHASPSRSRMYTRRTPEVGSGTFAIGLTVSWLGRRLGTTNRLPTK